MFFDTQDLVHIEYQGLQVPVFPRVPDFPFKPGYFTHIPDKWRLRMVKKKLAQIVGSENILDAPEKMREYSGIHSFIPGKTPVCTVKPAGTDELQKVVKMANEEHIPLVPVSSGAPHFRGDTVPGVDGAVMVDLSRMKRIMRIDPANRVAIVEPGVTFGVLQSELARSGLSAYMPLAPRSTKSVIASVLERDPIIMPGHHFDSTDPMLCVEIVFGTGDKMRTGEAAGPDPLEKQWEIGKAQISPFGPTQMDPQRLVSGAQGTIGIVTWMSLKCRFISQINRSFFIPNTSLEPLIELSYRLTRIRFSGNIFILNGLNLACLIKKSSKEIQALQADLPPWIMFVSCEGYGPLLEEKVQYMETDLREIAESYGLNLNTAISGIKADLLENILTGPSTEPYWKLRLRGGFSDVLFLTTQGKTPRFALEILELAQQQGHSLQDMGVYIQPVMQGVSCHCELNFYYDPENQRETELTRKWTMKVADYLEDKGAFFSRPYGEWAQIAYRHSADTVDIQKKMKKIFDPNGILNPGKLCF